MLDANKMVLEAKTIINEHGRRLEMIDALGRLTAGAEYKRLEGVLMVQEPRLTAGDLYR